MTSFLRVLVKRKIIFDGKNIFSWEKQKEILFSFPLMRRIKLQIGFSLKYPKKWPSNTQNQIPIWHLSESILKRWNGYEWLFPNTTSRTMEAKLECPYQNSYFRNSIWLLDSLLYQAKKVFQWTMLQKRPRCFLFKAWNQGLVWKGQFVWPIIMMLELRRGGRLNIYPRLYNYFILVRILQISEPGGGQDSATISSLAAGDVNLLMSLQMSQEKLTWQVYIMKATQNIQFTTHTVHKQLGNHHKL